MSNSNWISAASASHLEALPSKSRSDFGVEASGPPTHFCGTVKQRPSRHPMSLQTTFGLNQGATRQPGRNAAPPAVRGLTATLVESRALKCTVVRVDHCISQNIDLTRDEPLHEKSRPFCQ
jgi:hypothetical protein